MPKPQDGDTDCPYGEGQPRDTDPIQGKGRPLWHDGIFPLPYRNWRRLPDHFRF